MASDRLLCIMHHFASIRSAFQLLKGHHGRELNPVSLYSIRLNVGSAVQFQELSLRCKERRNDLSRTVGKNNPDTRYRYTSVCWGSPAAVVTLLHCNLQKA